MQLYSNIDEEDYTLHRMLYVFTCLSPVCIGTQRAIRVYRGYAKDDPKKFASEDQYNLVSKSNDQELRKKGLLTSTKKEEEEKKQMDQEGEDEDLD